MIKSLTYSEYLSQKILKISNPVEQIFYTFTISILGNILLILSSKINFKIPFTMIPFTMQTFAVLFLSMLLGRKVLYVLSLYLFEGILGLPVFSYGGGVLYIVGPTGGYILGFFIAGYICALLAEYGFDRSFIKTFFCMIVGNLIIYIFGILWLLRFVNFDFLKVLHIGVIPFIISDFIKIIFASLVLPLGWKIIK